MRRSQMGLKASNVVLSALVVAIFIYLLILAMAQDQVVEKLSRSTGFANYSSSLLDAQKATEGAEQIRTLARQRDERRNAVAAVENKAAEAELAYQSEAAGLDSVFEKIDGKGDCRILRKPTLAVPGLTPAQLDREAKRVALASAQLCFNLDPQLGGDTRGTYIDILRRAQVRTDLAVKADIARKMEAQHSQALQDEINRLSKDTSKLAPARIQVMVLDSLQINWLPINFVNYPPFIIRVLLSFFSGTFGALLVTMVFLVYPSKLRERVSAKLYYKRVFLGGLVALTVFIVLTGGASIVGGSEASQDDTNVMSFTAIGLLAGMFSDTVADWLSARAKTMFSTEDEDDDKDRREGAREPGPSTPGGSDV